MKTALNKCNYTPDAEGPLTDLGVLDLSRLFARNDLTEILGDFGAEVIKVEPSAGDTLHGWLRKESPRSGSLRAEQKEPVPGTARG
jgi:crotonobetainyl-CoA:carnitine CoA-transferase CaiB-like acyl-CoA transferase